MRTIEFVADQNSRFGSALHVAVVGVYIEVHTGAAIATTGGGAVDGVVDIHPAFRGVARLHQLDAKPCLYVVTTVAPGVAAGEAGIAIAIGGGILGVRDGAADHRPILFIHIFDSLCLETPGESVGWHRFHEGKAQFSSAFAEVGCFTLTGATFVLLAPHIMEGRSIP